MSRAGDDFPRVINKAAVHGTQSMGSNWCAKTDRWAMYACSQLTDCSGPSR